MTLSSNHRVIVPLELAQELYAAVVAQAQQRNVPVEVFCYGPCVEHINAFGQLHAIEGQPAGKLNGAHFYANGQGIAADLILSPTLWSAMASAGLDVQPSADLDAGPSSIEECCGRLCEIALAEKTGVALTDTVKQEEPEP